MFNKKRKATNNDLQFQRNDYTSDEQIPILHKKTIKELIAPSGIDASNIDHLEIISNVKRYARSFFVSALPRMCTFPELFRDMYMFGDINTSIYITPIQESRSQNELNRTINELETERIVAADRGNINRESNLAQKRYEAEECCLSLTGFRKAIRYEEIEVEYLDANFNKQKQKFTGFVAQIIQHEIDHCNGIII